MEDKRLFDLAIELQSIAQAGLYYGSDVFDIERYERIREIASELLSIETKEDPKTILQMFAVDYGYQTPKIDTRAAVFKDGKILLVKENDGRWSLPGGWCDFNLSPLDNVIKEAKEEAGIDIVVKGVIAVQDKDKHNKPKYVYNITKIFYLAEELGGNFEENIETLDAKYFPYEKLPELSEEKTIREQVKMCFDAYNSENWKTQFD